METAICPEGEHQQSGKHDRSVSTVSAWRGRSVSRVSRVRRIVATLFRNCTKAFRAFYSQLDRLSRKPTSKSSVLCTMKDALLYSVSMMLLSCATFSMSFIFAILAGSITIFLYTSIAVIKSGRRMRRSAQRIRTSIASKVAEVRGYAR